MLSRTTLTATENLRPEYPNGEHGNKIKNRARAELLLFANLSDPILQVVIIGNARHFVVANFKKSPGR